jgi:hypothetical protein
VARELQRLLQRLRNTTKAPGIVAPAQPIVNHLAKLVGLIQISQSPRYRSAQELKPQQSRKPIPLHGWQLAGFNEPIDRIGPAMHNPRKP